MADIKDDVKQNARPELVDASFQSTYKDCVEQWPLENQQPVVYHKFYNITAGGLEKLHSFDSCKFRKVVEQLVSEGCISLTQVVTPLEASREALRDVHTEDYLQDIHTSRLRVVQVSPMKYHVGGTILATGLAIQHGWAVNIGGGMHHAFSSAGGGWCPFDDIMLAIRRVRKATGGKVQKVMYIDLDAHQGNGVERDKLRFQDNDVIILDVYHKNIYPNDREALPAINYNVPVVKGCADEEYLRRVKEALDTAHAEHPDIDLVFYNAGTDILAGDPLGRLGVTAEGIVQRDELVWSWAAGTAKAPIVVTLSGGYTKEGTGVIGRSLANIMNKFGLVKPVPVPVPSPQ